MKKMLFSERSQKVLSKGITETLYLAAIGDNSVVFPMCWNVQLLLNNHKVSFKLDTGAEVTAINEWSYQSIGSRAYKNLRNS